MQALKSARTLILDAKDGQTLASARKTQFGWVEIVAKVATNARMINARTHVPRQTARSGRHSIIVTSQVDGMVL